MVEKSGAGQRHVDLYIPLDAVLLKKRGQALVGGIHVVGGKCSIRAGNIDRAHDDLVHSHLAFTLEAGSVDAHDEDLKSRSLDSGGAAALGGRSQNTATIPMSALA